MVRLSFLLLLSLLKVDADDVGADADASFFIGKRGGCGNSRREGRRGMFVYSVLYIYGIVNNSYGMWVTTIKGHSNVFFFIVVFLVRASF